MQNWHAYVNYFFEKQTNQTTYVQESVKDAIKKTVEKYYKKNS